MATKLTRLSNAWDTFKLGLADNEVIKSQVDALTELLNALNAIVDTSGNFGDVFKPVVSGLMQLAAYKGGRKLLTSFNIIPEGQPMFIKPTWTVNGLGKDGEGSQIFNSARRASAFQKEKGLSGENITINTKEAGYTTSGKQQLQLTGAIQALTAAILVSNAINSHMQEGIYTASERLDTLSNLEDSLDDRLDQIQNNLSSFIQTRKEIADLSAQLKSMSRNSAEWYTALQENNNKVDELVAFFPELKKNITITSEGIKSITSEGWNKYENYLKDTTYELQQEKQLVAQQKVQQEQSEAINSLIKTSTITQQELDTGAKYTKMASGGLSVVGGAVGTALVGAKLGTQIGTVAPGIGNAIGLVLGGLIGGAIGLVIGSVTTVAGDAITKAIANNGAKESNVRAQFQDIAQNRKTQVDNEDTTVIKQIQDFISQRDNYQNVEVEDIEENTELSGKLDQINESLSNLGYDQETINQIIDAIKENGTGTVKAIYAQAERQKEETSNLFQAGLQIQNQKGLTGAQAENYQALFQQQFPIQESLIETGDAYQEIIRQAQKDGGKLRVQTSDLSSEDAKTMLNDAYKAYAENHGYQYSENSYLSDGVNLLENGVVSTLTVMEEYLSIMAQDATEKDIGPKDDSKQPSPFDFSEINDQLITTLGQSGVALDPDSHSLQYLKDLYDQQEKFNRHSINGYAETTKTILTEIKEEGPGFDLNIKQIAQLLTDSSFLKSNLGKKFFTREAIDNTLKTFINKIDKLPNTENNAWAFSNEVMQARTGLRSVVNTLYNNNKPDHISEQDWRELQESARTSGIENVKKILESQGPDFNLSLSSQNIKDWSNFSTEDILKDITDALQHTIQVQAVESAFGITQKDFEAIQDLYFPEEGKLNLSAIMSGEAIKYIYDRKSVETLYQNVGGNIIGQQDDGIKKQAKDGNTNDVQRIEDFVAALAVADYTSIENVWQEYSDVVGLLNLENKNIDVSALQEAQKQTYYISSQLKFLKLEETSAAIDQLSTSLKELRKSTEEFVTISEEQVEGYVTKGLKREDFVKDSSGNYRYVGEGGKADLIEADKNAQKTAIDAAIAGGKAVKKELEESGKEVYQVEFSEKDYDDYDNDGNKKYQPADNINDVVYNVFKTLAEGTADGKIDQTTVYNTQLGTNSRVETANGSEIFPLLAFLETKSQKEYLGSDFYEQVRDNLIIDAKTGTATWKKGSEAIQKQFADYIEFMKEMEGLTEEEIGQKNLELLQEKLSLFSPSELLSYISTNWSSDTSQVTERILKSFAADYKGIWAQIENVLENKGLTIDSAEGQIIAAQMIRQQEKESAFNDIIETISSQAKDFYGFAETGIQSETFTEAVSKITKLSQTAGLDWDQTFIKEHAEALAKWASGEEDGLEAIQNVLKDQAVKAVGQIENGENYTEQLAEALNGLNEDILKDLAQWKEDGGDLTDNTKTFIANLMTTLNNNIKMINAAFKALGMSSNLVELTNSPDDNTPTFTRFTYKGKTYATREEVMKQAGLENNNSGFKEYVKRTSNRMTDEKGNIVPAGDEKIEVKTYALGAGIGGINVLTPSINKLESETNYSSWENPYDRQYNFLKKIEHEQENRNRLETEYNSLQKAGVKTSSEYARNLEQQQASLANERAQQQQLLQNRRSEIALINQEYAGQQVNGRDITSFVSWDENGTLQIDWSGIQALESLTENLTDEQVKERELLTKYIDEIETTYESIEETTSTIKDIDEQQLELAETQQKAAADLADKVQQGLTQQRQDEIDRLSKVSEAISTSNSKLLDSIRSSIDKMRQDRENAETAEELDEKRRRLAYLQLDTSGASDNQIRQLQEEIKDQEQSYRDSLVDQKIDELEEQNQFAEDQRQMQIELLQQQLEQMQNNPDLQAIQRIIAEGLSGNKNIVEGSQLDQLLKLAEDWKTQTSVEKQNQIEQSNAQLVGEQNANVLGGSTSTSARTSSSTVSSGGASSEIKSEQAALVASYGKQLGPKSEGYTNDEQAVINLQNALNDITSAGLDVDGSFGKQTKSAVENFQRWQGLGVDGHVGAETRAAFKKFQQYKTGGAVYDTGIAWLDGTPSRPEYVLNAAETQNFFALRDILSESMRNGAFTTQKSGDVYYQIDLKVEGGISSDYDVDRIISKVKSEIVSSQRSRNTNAIALGR